MFERLAGNEKIKQYLTHSLQKGCVGNSLLFAGPEGIGKAMFAIELAGKVLALDDPKGINAHKVEAGSHPDLHIYRPEGKIGMHSIESMRQFSAEVYMPPHESKRKVFIIIDAERMLPYSSNALLKTFEEPSPDTLIILVSSKPSALLGTILSRCRKLYFQPLTPGEIVTILIRMGVDSGKAEAAASLAQGSVGQAMRLLQPDYSGRREKILSALSSGFEDYSTLSKAAQEIAAKIDAANEAWAEAARDEFKRGFADKPTAIQQQAIDKEIDGCIAMRERAEAQSLFEVVLSWFRDLEALGTGVPACQLLNAGHADLLMQRRQVGNVCKLEDAFSAVNEVQTSLERSTGLGICLENLFLRLNLL